MLIFVISETENGLMSCILYIVRTNAVQQRNVRFCHPELVSGSHNTYDLSIIYKKLTRACELYAVKQV